MTDDQIISEVANHAAVARAHARPGPDGRMRYPTPAELESVASVALRLAIAEVISDPTTGVRLLQSDLSLTTTSGTDEYTLDKRVERVLGIRQGSDNRPLKGFDRPSEFDEWRWETYGKSAFGSTQEALAFYPSGRGSQNRLKITFFPGPGTETTMKIRYEMVVGDPGVSLFPTKHHLSLEIGALYHAAGGQFADAWDKAKVSIGRGLDVVAGGGGKVSRDDRQRSIIRRTVLLSSGSSLLHSGYVKRL